VEVVVAVDLEFELNLEGGSVNSGSTKELQGGRTSQFVAVRGTREKSQPCWEGRSEVRRTYLEILVLERMYVLARLSRPPPVGS
jgi:hypothetical protein